MVFMPLRRFAVDYPVRTLSQLRPILQGFRKAAGLTQAVMATHLGVTQQTYARLEANPSAISVERLFRALRVLGVDLTLTQTTTPPLTVQGADSIAPPSPNTKPNVARITRSGTVKTGSAVRAGREKRTAPSPLKKGIATGTDARAKPTAKKAAATTTQKSRADAGSQPSRPASKKGAVARKRENW
jgi:HTH-type transcriptional regulator / antitoxin HipB